MTTSVVTYLGDLRTRCEHLQSGGNFITDAPTDNQGRGEAFSPTDTVATALASCMLTIMGIAARDLEVDLNGSTAKVTKHMATDPRRISRIDVDLHLPEQVSESDRKRLQRAAMACPVHHSLHPDIDRQVHFDWSQQ